MSSKQLPIVAIVGSPNTGKSTLLNKIAGRPLAVTSDVAGTTRDRQYEDVSWNGVDFTLVDTAGLSAVGAGLGRPLLELERNVQKQIEIAVEGADVILMVVDGKAGKMAVDIPVIKKFRNTKKPVILAVNKLDSPLHWEEKSAEFMSLGIKSLFPVSAINGRGVGDMLDEIAKTIQRVGVGLPVRRSLGEGGKPSPTLKSSIGVSIIGKPNVGKSSIFNSILKEDRVVVSAVPGTTRTAIDSLVKIGGQDYTFIDTAGLKRKAYRQEQPDVFGGFQTYKAIRRSDVCFFVVDVNEEITKQDQHLASEIFELGKGLIILANKIDLYTSEKGANVSRGETGHAKRGAGQNPYQQLQDYISHHFPFLWMCPVFFVSGLTGEGLNEALAAIKPIYEARNKTVSQEELDAFLQKKMKQNPPKLLRDQKKPKVYGLKQLDINPPLFELYVNHPAAISQQFRKFVEKGIIQDLEFWGTPIGLKLKGKDKA